MPPVVPLEDALTYLGVVADTPEAAIVSDFLDAISVEARTLARRDFEGTATEYDEQIRIYRYREFTVPHVPVDAGEDITITPVLFDGTLLTPLDETDWRLLDAARGRFLIRPRVFGPVGLEGDARLGEGYIGDQAPGISLYLSEFVRVEWSTTGEVPATIRVAILEWLKDRFENRDQRSDLAGYTTGSDSESYFAALAGTAPASFARAALETWHPATDGVI